MRRYEQRSAFERDGRLAQTNNPFGRNTLTDIAFAPAHKLASMIRNKKIGALELLDHYIARIEKYNSKLNAIIATDFDSARKRAKGADRALAPKASRGDHSTASR
jgi:Amidase